MRFRSLLPVLFGLVFLAGQASAEETGDGLLNAMAYHPVPEGKTIAVRPLDDSDQNLLLKTDLEAVLKERGYSLSDDAPLILTFETREEGGAFSDGGRRTVLELEAKGGGLGGNQQSARLNIFDSDRGGVLNEGRGGTRVVTRDRYRLDLTLDERGRGRLWQAWATAETRFSDALTASRAMLGPMVDRIGKTARRETFRIP